MTDLLNGVPALDFSTPPRICNKCGTDIPDSSLGCETCAIKALPETLTRDQMLKRYRRACRAHIEAGKKVHLAMRALAVDCRHEVTSEVVEAADDRQGIITSRVCVFCGARL